MDEIISSPSPNFDERAAPVSILVLHYTGMPDAAEAIAWLRNPVSKVSSHYVVAEDGQVVLLVDEAKRAWHAGRSAWRNIPEDINSASVGIEIVNPGVEFGYRPFPAAQMNALVPLVAGIVARHGIEPANVVGHSDIAPARKVDPGELFPWDMLALRGLAVRRPARATMDPHWTDGGFLQALHRYGYDVSDGPAAVRAFQRRFIPTNIDGIIDGQTRAVLLSLLLDRERTSARPA